MIRRLLHYSSPRARRLVIAELAAISVTAVLQGIAFLMLVPLLRAVFVGDMDSVRTWLVAIAVVGAAYAMGYWTASQIGMKASTAVLDSLLDRLGNRLVDLPIAWFGTDRSGLLTEMATQGAMFVATAPYSFLRLIIIGFLSPATVLVGMYVVDWRLALAMTVMVPLMVFGARSVRKAIARGEADHSEAVAGASNRVIEFARTQPALRAAGGSPIAERLVEEALQDQHRAYRKLLAGGGIGIGMFTGIVQLSLTVVVLLGAYLAVGGSIEPATLVALLVLGVRFNEPIVTAGDLGGGVAIARNTLDRFDELHAVTALPEPDKLAKPQGRTGLSPRRSAGVRRNAGSTTGSARGHWACSAPRCGRSAGSGAP